MWPFCCFEITFFVSGTFPFLEEYFAQHYCSNSVFFILSVCVYYYFPFQSFCVFILKCVSCRQCIIESAIFSRTSLFIPWDSHTFMQCVFIIFNAFFLLQPLSDPLLHPVQCHVLLTKSNLCYPFTHGVEPSPGSWLIYQGDHTLNWLFLPQKPSAMGGCWSDPSHPCWNVDCLDLVQVLWVPVARVLSCSEDTVSHCDSCSLLSSVPQCFSAVSGGQCDTNGVLSFYLSTPQTTVLCIMTSCESLH